MNITDEMLGDEILNENLRRLKKLKELGSALPFRDTYKIRVHIEKIQKEILSNWEHIVANEGGN